MTFSTEIDLGRGHVKLFFFFNHGACSLRIDNPEISCSRQSVSFTWQPEIVFRNAVGDFALCVESITWIEACDVISMYPERELECKNEIPRVQLQGKKLCDCQSFS